ncbi:MAG TPA: hypothetical protein EYQ27_19360 [Gemmatimonadetes bacterium]|nr:hypothetical protein [Gemmatimonadota bacterium]
MAMRINTNVSAMNTLRQLSGTSRQFAQSVGRLSSGLRLNSASDDTTGLGIANKIRADVRSMRQARRKCGSVHVVVPRTGRRFVHVPRIQPRRNDHGRRHSGDDGGVLRARRTQVPRLGARRCRPRIRRGAHRRSAASSTWEGQRGGAFGWRSFPSLGGRRRLGRAGAAPRQ